MSQQRLEYAIETVEADFGDLVERRERHIASVAETLEAHSVGDHGSSLAEPAGSPGADERRLAGELMTERMRWWLDEPHPSLEGRTPREVAAGTDHAEVARLIRQLENGAERARRRGEPAADVTRLREELDLRDEFAA